jgi:hypothetical protein
MVGEDNIMSKYYKPVYEFLWFEGTKTLDEIAGELTALRENDISFKVVSFSHVPTGLTVLIVKDVLTEIKHKRNKS